MARLLVPLATVEWTQAGRCFLTLMSLPNESSDINERRVMAPLKDNMRGAATRVNLRLLLLQVRPTDLYLSLNC